jgi:hypothetical protein
MRKTLQRASRGFGVLQAVNREQGPGLAAYVLAELVGFNAGRVVRARQLTIRRRVPSRGPGFYSPALLLGPYHLSWGK